jgi:hypothetical protein
MFKTIKKAFCECDPYKCARYWIYQNFDEKEIPGDLWPHDQLKALEMIEGKGLNNLEPAR